jgi:hypothetical protein
MFLHVPHTFGISNERKMSSKRSLPTVSSNPVGGAESSSPATNNVTSSNKKPKKSGVNSPLLVHVCDDHNEVLPFLHQMIRRRRLPFHGISLIHIDAHADLSLPLNMSSTLVRDGNAICEYLTESPAGIAEFIIPTVLAGHISHMLWIRSNWTLPQFNDGHTSFDVGEVVLPSVLSRSTSSATSLQPPRLDAQPATVVTSTATNPSETVIRVTCSSPYYIDDSNGSMYADRTAMLPHSIQSFSLYVHSLASSSLNIEWLSSPAVSTKSNNAPNDAPAQLHQVDDNKLPSVSLGTRIEEIKQKPPKMSLPCIQLTPSWVLDICLDYFSTQNPFYIRLLTETSSSLIDAMRPVYSRALFQCMIDCSPPTYCAFA